MKPTYILQDWAIISQPSSPYQAPELWPTRLKGRVFGNPKFNDGEDIVTSLIVSKIDDETYETNNTVYKVGKKHPNFELYCDQYNSGV